MRDVSQTPGYERASAFFAIITLLCSALSLVGCDKGAVKGGADGANVAANEGAAGEAAAALPNRAGAALREAVDRLPEGVGMVVAVDVGGLTDRAFVELGKLLGIPGKDEKTRKVMGDFLRQRIGVNPFLAQTVAVFEYQGDFGALVTGELVLGGLDSRQEDYEGVSMVRPVRGLWAARVGDRFVLGKKGAVKGVIDASAKRGKLLKDSEGGKRILELAAELGEGDLVAAVDGALLEGLPELLPGALVEGIGYSIDLEGGSRVLVKANESTRKILLAKMVEGRNLARDAVDKAKRRLDRVDIGEGLAVIYADQHLDHFFELVKPVEEGDYLKIKMEGQSASLLPVLSSMSVIAVPAFIKYMRKAKTAEAIDMLDKIYKGAADYYSTPRVRMSDASKLDCQFPADQPLTPGAGTCCAEFGGADRNDDDRCDTDPDAWATPTWSALKFQITDEHYFVYSFDTNGKTGADAQFTANAHADLDCDGIMSTFQRYGRGDPQATRGECSVMSAAALFTQNETE